MLNHICQRQPTPITHLTDQKTSYFEPRIRCQISSLLTLTGGFLLPFDWHARREVSFTHICRSKHLEPSGVGSRLHPLQGFLDMLLCRHTICKKSLPVLVLGLLRVVLVKGAQYLVSYPSLLFVFELDTLLTMDDGTCHQIWCALELLPDACTDSLIPVLRPFLCPFITRMPISLLGLLMALGT